MERAVIESAKIYRIGELFKKKPRGLKLNETDALVITARTGTGDLATRTFYLCLKPDGTLEEDTICANGSRSRRKRLISFLRYYGIADNLERYNLRDGIGKWTGKDVMVLPPGGIIYVP